MKKYLLIVGEQSLLKLKLISILSRTSAILSADTLAQATDHLHANAVTHVIFCDRLFTDPELSLFKQAGVHLICLIGRDSIGDKAIVPQEDNVLQIVYDQLYGFSGYSTGNTMVLQLQKHDAGLVHPVLVDDIAFWLSKNRNEPGLYYLRGPTTVSAEEFLRALAMEKPAVTPLPDLPNPGGPGTVVLLRHTFLEGIDVVRHQWACSVNLIYKLPTHTPISGMTVAVLRETLGKLVAARLPESLLSRLDCVCPIPNSGIPYAQGVAAATHLPLVSAIQKQSASRCFHIENAHLREQMISSSMVLDPDLVRGKRICLVDEAIFTGATLKLLCSMLHSCGAAEIHVLIPTPPCTAQCQYCSIPTRPMLLETIPKEQLAEALGADSVTFQTKPVFEQVLAETEMICCECFS